MADIEMTPISEAGNEVVGEVSILYGTVKAMAPDGTVRVLDVNSAVYAEDQIITESDGSVSITLDDPGHTHLDIGRMSHVVIDADVYGGVTPEDVAQATAEAQEIQQALLAGDETIDVNMEATAAGGAASAGGGLKVYTVEATGEEGHVNVGAETVGYTQGTVDTIPGVNEIPVEPVVEPEPTPEPPPPNNPPDVVVNADGIGDTVYEAGLPTGSDAASNSEHASGSFTISDSDGLGDINSITIAGATFTRGADFNNIGDLVGQTFDVGYGTVELTSYSNGTFGYDYTLDEHVDNDSQAGATDAGYNESFNVTVADGEASATATVTVHIVDDVPNAVDDGPVEITEDDGSVHSGDVMPNDVHANGQVGADGVSFVSWDGTAANYGTFQGNGDGTYDYQLNTGNAAVQGLDTGETLTEQFNYTITDGDGDERTATLTFTINGENDAPVANADTNWAQEDGADASGNVLQDITHSGAPSGTFADVADTDVDGDSLTVSSVNGSAGNVDASVAGTYGTLVLHENGSYDYTLNDSHPDVQALDDGQTLTDTFSYTATDADAESSSANLTITIFGTNDAPSIEVDGGEHTVYEAGLPTGSDAASNSEYTDGHFTVADTDGLDDISTLTIAGTTFTKGVDFNNLSDLVGQTFDVGYGTVELTSYSNGTFGYDYTLDEHVDNDSQAGATDAGYDESFNVTVSDGDASDMANITVHIVDDEPMAGDPQDAILANVLGNEVTGDLHFTVGADTDATYQLINLTHGDPVMNANGNVPVTSDDAPVMWADGGDGSWSGVTDINDPGNTTVFTIHVNGDGTYTVDMSDTLMLDGAAGIDVVIGQGIHGGNDNTLALFDVDTPNNFPDANGDNVPDDAKHMFFIEAYDEDGSGSTVNTNSHLLGVGGGQDISNDLGGQDGNPATSETLTIWFAAPEDPTLVTDPATDLTLEPVENVELELSNWNHQGTTGAHWVAYNGDGDIVGEGDIAHGVTDFLIDADPSNDGADLGGTVSGGFVRLELTANTEDSYKVAAISGVTEVGGSDVTIDLTAQVTDGDGDQAQADFQVTFDADGDIVGDEYNQVISGVGATSIDGGDGDDTVSYVAATAGVAVDLSDTNDHITSVENVIGSDHADTLTGDSHANMLYGGAGDDTLHGLGGDDILHGGDGADTLYGDAGDDTLHGGAGADTLVGGDGSDTLSYDGDTAGVVVDLSSNTASGGDAQGDSISGFEHVMGGSGNDTLTGDDNANILDGGAGDDTLHGLGGDDVLHGGDGADTLYGDAGNDTLDGGAGNDTLDGGTGDDTLNGGYGDDILHGGDGADALQGGHGVDTLDGGAGNDTMTGGEGADTFHVGEGNDHITDYSQTQGDLVDISSVFTDVDHLSVSNVGGHPVLTFLDGDYNPQGSVSFDNLDYNDLTTGDELNSLLGQVDLDHNGDGHVG